MYLQLNFARDTSLQQNVYENYMFWIITSRGYKLTDTFGTKNA